MADNLEVSALNGGIVKLGTMCVCVCVFVCVCIYIYIYIYIYRERERERERGGGRETDIGATLVANAKNLNVQCVCGSSALHCHPLFKALKVTARLVFISF